jgi:bacterioferritin
MDIPAMKGDAKVIEFLNKALFNELTAINQYWLHYRLLRTGASRSSPSSSGTIDRRDEACRHAGRSHPVPGWAAQFPGARPPEVGESVEEVLKADLALEYEAVPLLKDGIAHCETVRDYVSRDLLQKILESEKSTSIRSKPSST